MHVEQHDIDALGTEQILRTLDRGRFEHPVTLELEIDAAKHSQAVVVIDDEHGVSHFPHVAGSHCSAKIAL